LPPFELFQDLLVLTKWSTALAREHS